jgi:FKBP12-rapamycin complex-associated protein
MLDPTLANGKPSATETTRTDVPVEPGKFTVNQQHVKQAWDISQLASKPDWLNWYHSLSAVLIRESPSPALRACMNVVSIHSPLLTELFNAAFISCWGELYDQYQVGSAFAFLPSY